MLKFITWQQYLYTLLTTGASYYVIILLLYYWEELSAIFNRKAYLERTTEPMWPKSPSILGEIKQERQEFLLSSENLQFSPEPYDERDQDVNQ